MMIFKLHKLSGENKIKWIQMVTVCWRTFISTLSLVVTVPAGRFNTNNYAFREQCVYLLRVALTRSGILPTIISDRSTIHCP